MSAPTFSYVLPVHNDEGRMPAIVDAIVARLQQYPGSEVLLVENGSKDRSAQECADLAGDRGGVLVRAFHLDDAGMGYALHRGMNEAFTARADQGGDDAWVMLTASDLPFGFTDLDSFLEIDRRGVDVVIGSKAHPQSIVASTTKRRIATLGFRVLRRVVVGMRTQDSQGTFLVRRDLARAMAAVVQARDFFYSTELCARLEARGIHPVEVPVVYPGETRPSTVRLRRDATRMFKQLVALRRTL